ncbi:secondary thiamine-phosphate synthase enzyme YjbQ [Streptomyces sp. NPDC026206]|uniref:secondary thiamine-phosphate synthase enzyme YjbQ n=1 Tax=Streptomyces sp. NPDC026206 TaxID=3157089 RepID=UPI003407E318
MTTVSGTRIDVISHGAQSPGSSIAVSARISVTIGNPDGIVDLTGALRQLAERSGVIEGTLHLYCGHTTCGLIINERDSGLESDLREILERIAPHSDNHYYAHDKLRTPAERRVHGERDNGHSHARAIVSTHPELNIPITSSSLYLGQWQTVLLAEFDGPRTRELLARVHNAM